MIKQNSLSDVEKASIRNTRDLLFDHRTNMIEKLTKSFRSAAFENRFSLHPRRLEEKAVELVDSLDAFLMSNNPSSIHMIGREHAYEGMGEKSMFIMERVIKQFYSDTVKSVDADSMHRFHCLVDDFVANYLLGYMSGQKQHLLREQELLRSAVSEVHRRVAETGAFKRPDQPLKTT